MADVTKLATANTVVLTGWTNPTNAYTNNNVYATTLPGKNTTKSSDFGFDAFTTSDIPDGSTINSITGMAAFFVSTNSSVANLGVQLNNNGSLISSKVTNTAEPASETPVFTDGVVGAITLADLRNSNHLKVRVEAIQGSSSTAVTYSLDYVQLTVNYTPPPSLTQAAFRYYADGTESGSSALQNQDTNHTADVSSGDVNLQLRVRLQETAAGAGLSTDDYQLQYERNDDGVYGNVGTAATGTFGTTSGAGVSTGGAADAIVATKYTLTESGFANKLSVYTVTSGNTKVGIYTDNAGAPNTLVVANNAGTAVTGGQFNDISLTPTFLAAGTYWLAFVDSVGNMRGYVAGGTNQAAYNLSQTYASGCPGTFPSPSYQNNNYVSYATYSNIVFGFNSGSLTDGNATTNRLGSGTGSFVAGKISEDGLVDNTQITASNYTELLYSLTIDSDSVEDDDTLDFRILRNGATTGMTYTVTPRITIQDSTVIVTQDTALALTMDATTITQNHVVASQDSLLSLTLDNTTITQNHIIQPQDIALALSMDNTTIEESYNILPQDIALSLAEDATTISQNHVVASNDIALALTEDNTTITQDHVLPVNDIALSLTEDATTINQDYVIAVQDIGLSSSMDTTTISQNHVISVQDILLSLALDSTTLAQNHVLVAQDILLSLSEDATTLNQLHIIATQSILLSTLLDSTSISQVHTLVTSDLLLSLSLDETTIESVVTITIIPDDISLGLALDNITLVIFGDNPGDTYNPNRPPFPPRTHMIIVPFAPNRPAFKITGIGQRPIRPPRS